MAINLNEKTQVHIQLRQDAEQVLLKADAAVLAAEKIWQAALREREKAQKIFEKRTLKERAAINGEEVLTDEEEAKLVKAQAEEAAAQAREARDVADAAREAADTARMRAEAHGKE